MTSSTRNITLTLFIAYSALHATAAVLTFPNVAQVSGTIPGVSGMQIHIVELAIGGDAAEDSGPYQFSVAGGGLSFSWAAGQSRFPSAATYILPPTPPNPRWPYAGFTYASVSHLADVGASVVVQFDGAADGDGWFTYAADSLGTFYDDSALLETARVWVRYEYVPLLSVGMLGTNISIVWPTAATNFMLEACSTLGSSNLWIGVTATQEVAGAYRIVKEPAVGAQRFYRLRRP